ncbi:MAG: NAD(P)H-quinone oxidoreductase [Thermoanaerobaculia bacterium]
MKAISVLEPLAGSTTPRLALEESPDPVPGPGEVVVRVRATAVNRADLLQAAGKYPPPPGASPILGLEASGETEAGERVFFLLTGGGYAEKVSVPRGMLMPIPDPLSFEEAAAIPEAWFTAYLNLFIEGGLERGERALVHAAGSGVGTAAVQLIRRAGAVAIGTARSKAKCEAVLALGAELAVDTSADNFRIAIEARYGPQAIHVVLDPVGGATFAESVAVLAREGRLVLIATMGGAAAELDLRALLSRRLRLIGSTLRARALDEKLALTAGFVRDVLPGFADGTLRPVIQAVLPLDQAGEAHRRMAANENLGKLVLSVQSNRTDREVSEVSPRDASDPA